MKELVMYIVKALVDNPDEVTVEETMEKDEIILKLKVSQDDVGKVIGKQGRIAKAIRTVLKSAGNKENVKVSKKNRHGVPAFGVNWFKIHLRVCLGNGKGVVAFVSFRRPCR